MFRLWKGRKDAENKTNDLNEKNTHEIKSQIENNGTNNTDLDKPGSHLIDLRHIFKIYYLGGEEVRANDDVSVAIDKGEFVAIVGKSGSGKSTFSKILADVLPADRKIRLEPSIGYLPQKPYAFRMSVRKNILLGGRDIQKAESLAKALSLTELEHKRADRLSGGETARMAMARLMMGTYDVVILDEPTAAMDMETTAAAETLIQSYVRQTNCILILVTHSLQQARRIADEAMFFQKGEVLEYGPAESLLYSPTRVELKRFLEFYGN